MNDSRLPSRLTNPASWLALFGPGAIVASLTIGSGELLFSSRGGALFGYRLLGLFLVICLLKWALVLTTSRQMILTGAHPFQRWMSCPGPRGWLPIVFLISAVALFPVWVGFHAATVGTLLASLTGTKAALRESSHFVWGLGTLGATMLLVWSGSYKRLERIQMFVVFVMLGCVLVSLVLLKPNWQEIWTGFWQLGQLDYPEWITRYPEISKRPLWVELATYVGVVGGSGYDYLAYVSFLRDKSWGAADAGVQSDETMAAVASDRQHPFRQWLIAPWIDASISFTIVLVFSAVFLACGTIVLRPKELVPTGQDLLTLQAEFVGAGATALKPFYFAGALLAMLGTLYGTIEVAPTVARELFLALRGSPPDEARLHRNVTNYVGLGGAVILMASLITFLFSGNDKPPGLVAILTPANLFTGVLACGIIAWTSLWIDRRWLPSAVRMPWFLWLINVVGGLLFIGLGLKAYWDNGGILSILMLAGTILAGVVAARLQIAVKR